MLLKLHERPSYCSSGSHAGATRFVTAFGPLGDIATRRVSARGGHHAERNWMVLPNFLRVQAPSACRRRRIEATAMPPANKPLKMFLALIHLE
jgi:hypothetical protein